MKKLFVFVLSLLFIGAFFQTETVHAADGGWRAAYQAFLKSAYENQEGYNNFALEDVNNDGISELFIYARGSVSVYTYNGKVEMLGTFGGGIDMPEIIKSNINNQTKYIMANIGGGQMIYDTYYEISVTSKENWTEIATNDGIELTTKVNGKVVDEKTYNDFITSLTASQMTVTEYPVTPDGITKSGLGAVTQKSAITVNLNGKQINFTVEPQNINGSIYVEMKTALENLGYGVQYVSDTGDIIVTKGGVTFTITKNYDGELRDEYFITYADTREEYDSRIEMPLQPQVINSKTMLPVKVIADLTGYDVTWNGNTQTVSIDNAKTTLEDGKKTVKISNISDNKEITVSGLYYEAGRSLESQNPVMVKVDGYADKKITTECKEYWIVEWDEYGTHKFTDFENFKSSFKDYVYYEITVENGVIIQVSEILEV